MQFPVTDVHAHIIVPEITREAMPEEEWRPRVVWKHGRQVIEYGGQRITSAVREITRIEAILEHQAKVGVERTLLCPWVSLLRYDADPQETLRTSRIQNEALDALVRRYPDKISALGTIPLQDPALAARELEKLKLDTVLRGVIVAASVCGMYLGDDHFRPFWAAAEATGMLVFIHPTTRGFDLPVFKEYYLWNALGNPMETTITAAHMILAGVMEAHPRLTVLLAHGGGALMSLKGRLTHAHRTVEAARAHLKGPPKESIRWFYYDTVTHDPQTLRFLVDTVGADHVLLGSDYPFDMGVERPVAAVRQLGFSPGDEAKILGGNAARLLGWE